MKQGWQVICKFFWFRSDPITSETGNRSVSKVNYHHLPLSCLFSLSRATDGPRILTLLCEPGPDMERQTFSCKVHQVRKCMSISFNGQSQRFFKWYHLSHS